MNIHSTHLTSGGLARFFADLVRRSFADLGLGTGETASYVVDLLVRFARSDGLYRIRDNAGRPLDTVSGMLRESLQQWTSEQTYILDRDLELRRHVGDFALFMSGIFRSHVERGGYLGLYLEEGEASYRAVGERLQMTGQRQGVLFGEMGAAFAMLSGALDYMRKVYMVQAARSGPYTDLLRQFGVDYTSGIRTRGKAR